MDENKKLLKIRQMAFDKVQALKGPETNVEVARAWFDAVVEALSTEGDVYLPKSLRLRMQAAYQTNPDEYVEALEVCALHCKKPAVFFTEAEHERSLAIFEVNTGRKGYQRA